MSQGKDRLGAVRSSNLEEKCAKELGKTRVKIAQQLREDMNSLLLSGQDSDLMIRVANQDIPVHKCIIRTRLPRFWKERLGCPDNQDTVTLDLPSSDDIKLILRYIYCEEDLSLLDEVLNSMTESKLAKHLENDIQLVSDVSDDVTIDHDITRSPSDVTNCNFINGIPYSPDSDSLQNGKQAKTQPISCQDTNHMLNTADNDSSIRPNSPEQEIRNAVVSCRLGLDLLNLYKTGAMTDLVLMVNGTTFNVHRCVLSARSSYFAAMLGGGWLESESGDVVLEGVTAEAIEPVLCYMYGGLVDLPPDVSLTEVVAISDMYAIAGLKDLVSFVIKRDKAHFFHKPCSECVPGTVSIIPLVYTYGITDIWERAMRWMAHNFARVWTAKQFATLPEEILEKCLEHAVQDISRNNVIDMVTDCDRLMGSLTNVRRSEPVVALATRLMGGCINYLRNNMVPVMSTPKFAALGITMALGLSILEDIFSQAILKMPPERACQTYTAIQGLVASAEREDCIWNEDFKNLVGRLSDKCNHFMMLHINELINTPGWTVLSPETQEKIKNDAWYVSVGDETFVRKLPPRLAARVPPDPRKASVRPKTVQPGRPASAPSRSLSSKRLTTTTTSGQRDAKGKRSQGIADTSAQVNPTQSQRSTTGSKPAGQGHTEGQGHSHSLSQTHSQSHSQGHSKVTNQQSRSNVSSHMPQAEKLEGQMSEGQSSDHPVASSASASSSSEHLSKSMSGDTVYSVSVSSSDSEGVTPGGNSSMEEVSSIRPVPVLQGVSHRVSIQQPLVWTFTAPDFLYVQQRSDSLSSQ